MFNITKKIFIIYCLFYKYNLVDSGMTLIYGGLYSNWKKKTQNTRFVIQTLVNYLIKIVYFIYLLFEKLRELKVNLQAYGQTMEKYLVYKIMMKVRLLSTL
jgi:hypothetical protein